MALKRMALALGVGYVLGARAGEKRYQELKDLWDRLAGSPLVQRAGEVGRGLLDRGMESVTEWSRQDGDAGTQRGEQDRTGGGSPLQGARRFLAGALDRGRVA